MSFDDIRKGFKTVIEANIEGLTVYAYPPDGGKEYPCLMVEYMSGLEYSPITEQGGFYVPMIAVLYVFTSSYEVGIKQLEAYAYPNGADSIFAAVNVDHTLDGSLKHAWVSAAGEPDIGHDEQADRWEFHIQLTVQITGSVN